MKTIEKVLPGTCIHYWITESSAAESILFVHAAFADHTSFDTQLTFFADQYRTITLDLTGHGKSVGAKAKGGVEKTAAYIAQIMDAEGIEKLHLVGVSIGAVLIQDFANQYPGKVASLCCIGGYDINRFDPSIQKANTGEQIKMMLKAVLSVKWFAQSNKRLSAVTPQAQEKFYQMNVRFRKSSFRCLAGLSKLVNRHDTKRRGYPLLIGCGEADAPVAVEVAKAWHASEPESNLVLFKNAGHLVNMDAPKAFNEALFAHIAGKK